MGFFDTLRRVLGGETGATGDYGEPSGLGTGRDMAKSSRERVRLAEAWGLDDSAHPEYPGGQGTPADPAAMAAPPLTSEYDRDQWRRKLKRILEKLPESQSQWTDLLAEAGALGLDPTWV